MAQLVSYTAHQIKALTRTRSGETKLGEEIGLIANISAIQASPAKFVLLGICEDIGVRANFGISGSESCWNTALTSLLNIQSGNTLPADQLAILGYLDFTGEQQRARTLDPSDAREIAKLRSLVNEVDQLVEKVIKVIFSSGKIPIVIGGGHNNSYPIIKALSAVEQKPVNVINLDAHADFRAREGRHSGNGFSYAFHEKLLGKYAVIGLHEDYNAKGMIAEMANHSDRIKYYYFEDFLKENTSFDKAFGEALNFTHGECGLEIDMDCMAYTLSSAITPVGFSGNQIRELIYQTKPYDIRYLHIAEGATRLSNGLENVLTGKLIAYFISDFIKVQS